ncbi:MAG: PDGLE domain-containing protein [Parcubacteria group bacterium]|nr:PDGLE domain-containing protein [Parcubacteria group bacterium]
MHIPSHMIQGSICPVTATVSVAGIGLAAYLVIKSKKKPKTLYIAAVAAFIFAAQMINFPIQNGTSGHLIGATLATALLGMPLGILVMSIVLAIQCLVFADGGLLVLGANILNMAIIGSLAGGFINKYLIKEKVSNLKKYSYIGFASWISVILATIACSFELAISRTIELSKVLPAMLNVHALIGVGEALITVSAFAFFSSKVLKQFKKYSFGLPLATAAIIGLMLSPFASSYPDGLEWAAQKYGFLHEAAPAFITPLPNYTIPFIENNILSTGLAGILGVFVTFLFVLGIIKLLTLNYKKDEDTI